MSKTTNFFILTVAAISIDVSARTASLADCTHLDSDHPQKAKRYLMCLDGNIELLERDRQAWINKLLLDTEKIEKDTGNTQLMPIIKRSLLSQSRYMEDSCKWRYLKELPNSTKAAKVYKRCKISFLQHHTEELKANF